MKVGHTEFSNDLLAELKELTLEEAKSKYPNFREVYLIQLTKKEQKESKKSKK